MVDTSGVIPIGIGQVNYEGMSDSERRELNNLVELTHEIIVEKMQAGGPSICWLELLEEFKKAETELQDDLMDLRIALAWLRNDGCVALYDDRVLRMI